MAKRKMIQNNLLKNSIAAYLAAIEIHNKPNIPYRYEIVTLLIINSWELALKAYVRKYIRIRSIFIDEVRTISLDKALNYVDEHLNSIKRHSFTAIKENIILIEDYRDAITHFYCDQIEPYIFMLVARSALNYVDFMKEYFARDVIVEDGLYIMPLGFKLPFKPEDFLTNNVAKFAASEQAKVFVNNIVTVMKGLQESGVEDSIVLGFNIHFDNVKNEKNSDILAAITSTEDADATFSKTSNVIISDKSNAKEVHVSEQNIRDYWKYTHAELVSLCRECIPGFKQNKLFNYCKKQLGDDKRYVYTRRLDSKNEKSSSQKFYSNQAVEKIKKCYENEIEL